MKTIGVLGMSALLLALIFQCCPSSSTELPSVEAPTEQAATPPSEPPPEETAPPPPPAEPTPTPSRPSPTAAPEPTVPTYSEPVVLTEVEGTGGTITDNFEWPACQKAVFYWTASPDSHGMASLILHLHKTGEEQYEDNASTAEIKGVPERAGEFEFTVSASCYGTNVSGQTGERRYRLLVKQE